MFHDSKSLKRMLAIKGVENSKNEIKEMSRTNRKQKLSVM